MGESFELSLISRERTCFNSRLDGLKNHPQEFYYNGVLSFYNNRTILLREFEYPSFWEYEISVSVESLFMRENIIDRILLLLEAVCIIHSNYKIEYSIANIESNSSLIDNNLDALLPSKDMILKSSLIFIPESKINSIEINVYHVIFKLNKTICLYNPNAGILFSSADEKYKILKESFT